MKTSPIRVAAQNDPRVQEAMRHITQATEELYQALADLGESTPRLSGFLSALGPGLCAQAVQLGSGGYNHNA